MSIVNNQEKIICNMYQSHSSIREISRITKISPKVIKKVLLQNKITIVKHNVIIKPNQIKLYIDNETTKMSALSLPDNTKTELFQSYLTGTTALELAKKYNVKYRSVIKLIYNNGIKRNKMPSLVYDDLSKQKDSVIKLYNDGHSVAQLAQQLNVSESAFKDFLLKNHVKLRGIQDLRKYTFDKSFFETDSDQLYYFMGFCLGDGNIGHHKIDNRYNLSVTVQTKDKEILYMFCDWINIPYGAVSKFSKKEAYRLIINSNYFKNGLPKFGLVPNKTYEPCIPDIPKQYLKPFILGLLDADGHIKYQNIKNKVYYRIDLVCNKYIINWYIDNLINHLNFSGHIQTIFPDEKIWGRANINKKHDVLSLAKLLNIENYPFIMQRKWSSILKEVSKPIQ